MADVLTGGADGIGHEGALAYGREGARVAIGDRHFDAAQHTAAEVGSERSKSENFGYSSGTLISFCQFPQIALSYGHSAT